ARRARREGHRYRQALPRVDAEAAQATGELALGVELDLDRLDARVVDQGFEHARLAADNLAEVEHGLRELRPRRARVRELQRWFARNAEQFHRDAVRPPIDVDPEAGRGVRQRARREHLLAEAGQAQLDPAVLLERHDEHAAPDRGGPRPAPAVERLRQAATAVGHHAADRAARLQEVDVERSAYAADERDVQPGRDLADRHAILRGMHRQ